VVGADHRGAEATGALVAALERAGHSVRVMGACESGKSVDYPEPAYLVGREVTSGRADAGILVCGTGIGMSIAANKVPGVRAAVVTDELTAQLSRAHNDANVLCVSGDLLGARIIEKIALVFLSTAFEGGRHARRVEKIGCIERGQDPASCG
jgi:ribose 5-phosphate isomerase B